MAPSAIESPTAAELTNNDILRNLKKNTSSLHNGFATPEVAPLDASKLIVTPNTRPKAAPVSGNWVKQPTDHMITVEWTSTGGWAAPHLTAYSPLQLEPSASCLHYATQCFEGMKLYRGVDGRLRVFRPHLNAERFCRSAARGGLPTFDAVEAEKLIVDLCAYEGPKFLPRNQTLEQSSAVDQRLLYIRPMLIGTDADVGIKTPAAAQLIIFLTTFPSLDKTYLGRPQPGLKLLASRTNEVRAWPGGFGAAKLGANYGPSLVAQREAARLGYDQVLWLYSHPDPLEGDSLDATVANNGEQINGSQSNGTNLHRRREGVVTEAGASNFFVIWTTPDGVTEIVTAPLAGGIILDGVTRRSVLELVRSRLDKVKVTERWFSMAEVHAAATEGRLQEAFAAGTAYFITPIAKINWQGEDIEVPNQKVTGIGPVTEKIRKWLGDITYGVEKHEWAVILPEKQ